MLTIENNLNRKDFLIKVNKKFRRVKLDEILYFKSDGKYVSIRLKSGKLAIRSSLNALLLLLPSTFIRTHSSYIVNSAMISDVQNSPSILTLENGEEIGYSRTFRENLFEAFIVG